MDTNVPPRSLRLRQIRSTNGESEGLSLKVSTEDTTASVGVLRGAVNGPGRPALPG